MQIPLKADIIDIRLVVDFVDIEAYGNWERQSYAQVVVNGVRMRAGWGNSNVRKKEIEDMGFGLCINKAERKIGKDQEQKSNQDNSGEADRFRRAEKEMKEKNINGSKEKELKSGSNGVMSAPLIGGKQIKILQRIIPKAANDFRTVAIQSVNLQELQGEENSIRKT